MVFLYYFIWIPKRRIHVPFNLLYYVLKQWNFFWWNNILKIPKCIHHCVNRNCTNTGSMTKIRAVNLTQCYWYEANISFILNNRSLKFMERTSENVLVGTREWFIYWLKLCKTRGLAYRSLPLDECVLQMAGCVSVSVETILTIPKKILST